MSDEAQYVSVQSRFAAAAEWFRPVRGFMFFAWVSPADFCFGMQFLDGGIIFHFWPVSFGVVHMESVRNWGQQESAREKEARQ